MKAFIVPPIFFSDFFFVGNHVVASYDFDAQLTRCSNGWRDGFSKEEKALGLGPLFRCIEEKKEMDRGTSEREIASSVYAFLNNSIRLPRASPLMMVWRPAGHGRL